MDAPELAPLDSARATLSDSNAGPPRPDTPEAAVPAGQNHRGRSAWRTTRQVEPLILAVIALSAALLLVSNVVIRSDIHVVALTALILVFFWSYSETLRDSHSFERASRWARILVVVAAAPAFAFTNHSNWPWLWLVGLIAVHPCSMERKSAVVFVIAAFAGEEFFSFLLRGPNIPEAIARGAVFASIGALSWAWGEALESASNASRGIDLREQRTQVIAAYSDVILLFADEDYRLVHVNRAAERILGYQISQLRGLWTIDLIHPDDQESFKQERSRLLKAPGSSSISQLRIRNVNNQWIWFEVRITNLLEHPAIRGFFASAADITARMLAEEKLRHERALLRTVIDLLPMSVYTKSRDGRFLMSNRANLVRLGLKAGDDLVGKRSAEAAKVPQSQVVDRDDRRVLDRGEELIDQQYKLFDVDGSTRWYEATKLPLREDGTGRITGLLGIVLDVTEAKAAEVALREQATHDALTGLFNRRYLTEQLTAILGRVSPSPLALMFCDLDFFKGINDRYGHEIGDRFLTELGARLAPFGRESGRILARFGGDEFVLLAPTSDEEAALALGRALLLAIQAPIEVDGLRLDAEASIGIAMLRGDHRRPEDLIRDADSAMYQAKGQLSQRIAIFDDRLRARTTRHSVLVTALKGALDDHALAVTYQPKVNLRTGRIAGFEALLRWNTKQYGEVDPVEFIPLAEESGHIVRLGQWALEQACGQLRQWQVRYPHLDHLTIAVNVSMRQLLDDEFVDQVVKILEKSEIYPAALELELTETAAMQNPDRTIAILESLKSRGLRLALDDFGTGYSALAYLRRLPVDVLKIDRTFVHGLSHGGGDAEIIRLIIALAKTLGIEAIAEGIESRQSAEQLALMGCDVGQGFYFSRALKAADADRLLDADQLYPVAGTG
jgi:diguanylate cyclase (GGDEF)-like protein/PAS domain S-box-containing protein